MNTPARLSTRNFLHLLHNMDPSLHTWHLRQLLSAAYILQQDGTGKCSLRQRVLSSGKRGFVLTCIFWNVMKAASPIPSTFPTSKCHLFNQQPIPGVWHGSQWANTRLYENEQVAAKDLWVQTWPYDVVKLHLSQWRLQRASWPCLHLQAPSLPAFLRFLSSKNGQTGLDKLRADLNL